MRTPLVWSVAVALACSCGPAAGQTLLSESSALARLSAESPRVRAIRSEIDIARAGVLDVSRWPNPRLNVDRESVAGVSETITTVLQLLPVTGRRGFERSSATALAEAMTRRADDALRRARADLRRAYADLVAAQARERALTEAGDRLRELADVLGTREAAGDAAGFDRLRAEREVAEIEADRLAATVDRARAQGALAGFFAPGTDPSSLVADEQTGLAQDLPPVDVLVAQAERTRGEILALQQEMAAAQFSVSAADRRWIPEPEIVAGTKSSTALGGDLGSVFAVQAVLPLFDRGQPERALALARSSQAEARLDAFRLAVRAEIAALRTAALTRRSAADRYRAAASGAAGDIERIARLSYDAGERSILELLDAYRTSGSARVRQATLDAEAREAEIELEFASGWEIP